MPSPSETLQAQYGFFHGNSKFLNREIYTNTFSSAYKHGHVNTLQDTIAETLPSYATQALIDAWMVSNPGVLKKYVKQPLTPLALGNNEIYYIKDTDFGGKWMKPIILPELFPNTTSNLKSNGYQPYLYKEDGTQINNTDGMWWFDPYQGAVKFGVGYQPTTFTPSWGVPKITCYVYIGRTLDVYLDAIKPLTFKYTSQTPMYDHTITHGLDSIDLNINTKVQDSVNSNLYTEDLVGVTILDSNTLTIHLTELQNIKTCIQVIRDGF